MALLGGQPVSKAHTQLFDAFDSPNTSRQIRAEKAAVGCLVSQASHCTQPQVDGAGGKFPGLEVCTIPQNHNAIERKTRL